MKPFSRILAVCLVFVIPHPVLRADELSPESSLYFPPNQGPWETVQPEQVGWDGAKLLEALDYAGQNRSSGVVILHEGKILAEQYFEVQGIMSAKFRRRVLGRDKAGHAIEDVASVQKSITSILVGIAQQKGLLRIDDPVSQYLGVGWSRATPEQEQAITIRHLITMTSGLTDRGVFEAQPGTKWRYNTTAYAKSMDVVVAAARMDRHELTSQWLTQPLGVSDSKWVKRGSAGIQLWNPRHHRRSSGMELIALMVGTFACSLPATAEPCLVFSKTELPAIRDRVVEGQDAAVWQEILARANDYCTPGSRRYADPDELDRPVEGTRIQVLAHPRGAIPYSKQRSQDHGCMDHANQ